MDKNYWLKFWNEDKIIQSDNLQNQVGRTINKVPITDENWQFTLSFIDDSIKNDKPIIGNWFTKEFFTNAAFFVGFNKCCYIAQPEQLINHTHRFDFLMKK